MQKRFQDKVVLVTGASSGIGKVTAIEFARAGAKVVIAARRVEESQQVVKQIKEEGGEASFIQTDVSRHDSIRNLIEQTVKLYGRLDCAFNNAGIAGDVFTSTADHTEENWDAVMDVNLKGTFLCMKYEIAEMLKNGGGTIVNNSSVYGLRSSTVAKSPQNSARRLSDENWVPKYIVLRGDGSCRVWVARMVPCARSQTSSSSVGCRLAKHTTSRC